MKIPQALRLIGRKRQPENIGHIDVLTGRDLAAFLSDFSPEEMKAVRDLWQEFAARKTLIDIGITDAGESTLRT